MTRACVVPYDGRMALVGDVGICSRCMTVTRTEKYVKGWAWVVGIGGLFLVVALIGVPMVIAAFALGGGQRCPQCKAEKSVLPANTPAAKALFAQVKAAGTITAHSSARDFAEAFQAKQGGFLEAKRRLVTKPDGTSEWVDIE